MSGMAAVGAGGAERPRLSLRWREAINFYLFLAPWILGFLAFTAIPIVASLFLGFTKYNAISPPDFVGLKNFRFLYDDQIFWKSLRVTLTYTVVFVPLQLVSSLLLAMLLNLRVPSMRTIRTIYYLPSILPTVVTGLVW
ncbi:MAG: sugar ABC transporter permease, partial [Caldilineaceae bacterium SB0666_bin_21]|nr:sugar ABC transporter permease [Caldilineaceae bacterium SB0666_bin_21]